MYLDKPIFTTVINSTPLVSIDLLIENSQGQVLLGLRNNRPAKGFWFVPGGRIQKNEKLDDAFKRLCFEELGIKHARQKAEHLGPFEHFYDDFVFGEEVSTHYVVLGYKIVVDLDIDALPQKQHGQYQWFDKEAMRQDEKVHIHSKWYI
ncbi:GDP-mannose mannosyl hydrolase [Shewanella sp. 6_MG-2023]|uniref:GDP-mannose mannosyl hydrolase n=1 Tax=Shewanella sp. 6_MG-2023 TaxID=3062660 RepID=UPI0026E3B3A9|nr:GDP-mannose mannosyl hydrolase [Shewanella sp. 6_MG-2023]MDO6617625.1 GDP-mannose mannosyl hydrolase [Shewanella sp. 6_MG-2023]